MRNKITKMINEVKDCTIVICDASDLRSVMFWLRNLISGSYKRCSSTHSLTCEIFDIYIRTEADKLLHLFDVAPDGGHMQGRLASLIAFVDFVLLSGG